MKREEFDNLLAELSSAQVKWDTRFKLLAAYDDLATQRDTLAAKLADYEESYRRVIAEECAPDEQHCTCVPALRLEVESLRELAVTAQTLLTSGDDFEVWNAACDGWLAMHERWVKQYPTPTEDANP